MPPGIVRLFAALWPDDALREAIVAQRAQWSWPKQAQRVRAERLHLTLHFIGNVASERVDVLQQALRAVDVEALDLALDTAAVWRNGVASLLPQAPPAELLRLHAASGAALAAAGVELERRPYRPHLTLARRAFGAVAPAAPFALPWRSDAFVLVESGLRYTVIERYPRTSATGSAPKSARSR